MFGTLAELVALVVYVFSPWGPPYHATKQEVLGNLALLGFPASFFCFSVVYLWSKVSGSKSVLPYYELAACLPLWILGLWLSMHWPWNLITRFGAMLIALLFGVMNLLRARGTR